MGTSTILNPVLVGTVKNTTDPSTAGKIRNVGALVLSQTKNVLYSDAAPSFAFAIPAGAVVTSFQFLTTTTFTAASTITVLLNSSGLNVATTITTGGLYTIPTVNSQAVGQLLVNGVTDALVTYSLSVGASTAGGGTLIVTYIMRNADGTTTIPYTQA